jgi:ubiquinone/menaquinone biosynthesis C-methylase UbiE
MLTYLEAADSNSFDVCVMLNVLFALDETEKCLKEIHRVLKPKGGLVLSCPRKTTDIYKLFREIEKHYKLDNDAVQERDHPSNPTYKLYKQAFAHNKEMEPIIQRYAVDNIRAMIVLSNFRIVEEHPNEYVDCVIVIRAEKIPIVHARPRQEGNEPSS